MKHFSYLATNLTNSNTLIFENVGYYNAAFVINKRDTRTINYYIISRVNEFIYGVM